jgi:hypothetical protein
MHASEYAILVDLGFLGAVLLMVLPALIYLGTGWKIRRDKLFCDLNAPALEVYYEQFPWKLGQTAKQEAAKSAITSFSSSGAPPEEAIPELQSGNRDLQAFRNLSEKDQKSEFRRQFHYRYGRRHFVLPFVLLILISSFAAWGMALSVKASFHIAQVAYALPKIAISALLGAFAWAVLDELGRIQRRDVAPYDVYIWNFRFLVLIPIGFAFAAVVSEDFGIPLAFFLGVFPTQTLFTLARRIVGQRFGLGEQVDEGVLELEKLQSVGRANAERFEDEGINTISTLAWADPIDLTIRTNFDFNYVLDCMSQALLWVYLQDQCKLLYKLSLRGAQEVHELVKDLDKIKIELRVVQGVGLTRKQQLAVATLESAAREVGISTEALYGTFIQVAKDPYTVFIARVWELTLPGTEKKPT